MSVGIEANLVLFALSFLSGMLGGEAAFAALLVALTLQRALALVS